MTAGVAECCVSLGGGGCGGERKEAAVAVPGADGLSSAMLRLSTMLRAKSRSRRADGIAGVLDGVDVAGFEREGNGFGEKDAGVLEVAVDEERDGDEAGGVGLGDVAGPLVDADGTGDALGLVDVVHLRGERQSEGEGDAGAEDADGAHGC